MILIRDARDANLIPWAAGRPLVRVYNAGHGGPTAFTASPDAMRFRPVYERSGAVVPTGYGGKDGMVALAETVLREADVSGDRVLPAVRLRGLRIAKLAYPDDISLCQLNGPGLRKLGLTRAQVIDTGPSAYPDTMKIAQSLYDGQPEAHGIVWTSRQSDHGEAMILWGTRVESARLELVEGPYPLDDGQGLALVRLACEQFGVLLAP